MSKLKEFRDNLVFLADTARKPIIWLETFDYSYIIETLRGVGNVAIWNNASQHVTNADGVRQTSKKLELGTLIPQFFEGIFTAKENSKNNSFLNNANILVAQVSESLFEEDGLKHETRLIARLQEFVYNNYNVHDYKKKKTILLISTYHFNIYGLEHICERLTLPLPDIEDIDEVFGLIKTDKLVRDKRTNRVVNVGDLKRVLQIVESSIYEPVNEETENCEKKECFVIKKNIAQGLILRDEQNRVVDIMISDRHKLKYPFSKDFFENEKAFITHYQELVDALCGMYIYDIKELLESLKIKGENNEIQYQYDKEGKLLEIISERKKQIVNNSGLLEVIDYNKNHWMEVADIDRLLKHVEKEKGRINFPGNYPPQLPKPKGILLVGAPGCGKSESAKAVASKLEKPLYRLNIGNLLGHKYGQSENKFIEALRTADASAPCVLWIDEIEKAFAGAGNESENDDTLTHIVGYFLTWMQEHKTMVYLVATANDLSRMKPEMLRKGRWDETFYLSYPSSKGCLNILKTISENKFKLKLKGFENEEHQMVISRAMSKIPMSGAEIENVIVETIKEYPLKVNGHWYINIDDIAITFFKYIREIEKLSEVCTDETKYDINDIWKEIEKYCPKTEEVNKKDDAFINAKIEAEKLELEIKGLGQLTDDHSKNLQNLLEIKYKKQYKFKSASMP